MNRTPQLAALVVLATALTACHGRPTTSRPEPATGAAHPVEQGLVAAPGVVEPRGGEVRLAALEAGVLQEVLVREGEVVRAGALLARLEDSQAVQEVAVAEAEVRRARGELARTGPGAEEVRVARANARAASLREAQERRDAARAEALAASRVVSTAELERQRSAASVAHAGAEAARAELALVRRGARAAEREVAQAALDAAEARLRGARAVLARREVRAPVEGTVLWSRFHGGEYYAPAAGPLLVLGAAGEVQVRLELDDVDAARLALGVGCQLRDDGGVALGEGSLVRLAPEYATRALRTERPTERNDGRVREGFVELPPSPALSPGRRVWAYCGRPELHAAR